MNYLLSLLAGYLLGSFPTAYVILKFSKGMDITLNGTGNVGAMNIFEVSKSKILGILVFLIDALKGMLSVYLCLLLFPMDFVYPSLALLFAVLSHCYNPWLKFKGGRGLATAAGGTLLLFPILLSIWIFAWVIVYLFKRDIIFANILATFMSLILVFTGANIAFKYSFPHPDSISTLLLFTSALLIIIITRHFEPLVELINNKKLFGTKR